MSKFARLFQEVQQLGLVHNNLYKPEVGSPTPLETVHCEQYLWDLWRNQLDSKTMRRIGLPWSEPLMARTFTAPLVPLNRRAGIATWSCLPPCWRYPSCPL